MFVEETASSPGKTPTVLIVLGMAGTGKTSIMQRLNAHLHEVSGNSTSSDQDSMNLFKTFNTTI